MEGEFTKVEKHEFRKGERAERVIHQDNLRMEGEFVKRDRDVYRAGERFAQRKPKDNLALEGKIDFSGQLEKKERCAKAVVVSKKESVTWEVSKENNIASEPIKASDKKTTTSTVLAQVNGDASKRITQESKTSKVNTKTFVIRETRKKGAHNTVETTRELISATEGEPVFLHSSAVTATPDIPQTYVDKVKPTLDSYQVNADAKVESRLFHEKETHTAVSRGVAANNISQILNTGLTTKAIESHDATAAAGFRKRSDTYTKYGSQSSLADSISSERAVRGRGQKNVSSISFANYAIAEDATAQKSSTYERRTLAHSTNAGNRSGGNNIICSTNHVTTNGVSGGSNVHSSSTHVSSSAVKTGSSTLQSTSESSSRASSAVKTGTSNISSSAHLTSSSTGVKKDSLLSSADLQNSILHRKNQVSHSDINTSLNATAAIQRKSLSNLHEAHISTSAERKSISTQHRMGKQSTIKDLIMLGEHQTVKKTREVQVAQTSECKLHPVMTRKGNFSSITFSDFGTTATTANSRISTARKTKN